MKYLLNAYMYSPLFHYVLFIVNYMECFVKVSKLKSFMIFRVLQIKNLIIVFQFLVSFFFSICC